MDRRISKTTAAGTTEYVYDGPQVIAEYEDGVLARKFIYGPGIDEPIAMIAVDGGMETWYFYHYDGLGSVIALSNSSGTIVEAYAYDVFGTPTISVGAGSDGIWRTGDDTTDTISNIGNPYLFTGRRWDADTGLYYYRARMYSPALGRFLQPDPIGYADGMNLYAYCGNNPLNFIDPLGLCKGKPKELTDELLRKKMAPTVKELRKLGAYRPRGPIWGWHFYRHWDSYFFSNAKQEWVYNGKTYTGGEINYYAMGMLMRQRGWKLEEAIGWFSDGRLLRTGKFQVKGRYIGL
ncbi:MAG: RHS repeat-associated core domain-containing protein [Bacteroidales bacterium]|nr:RHS repeat-associated core domain-containing protein [Bacteroidales bacterium]